MPRCQLTQANGSIAVKAPYDSDFVYELKSLIPHTERRWDGAKKVWIFMPQYGVKVQNLCMKYFNELPLLPNIAQAKPTKTQKILDCRYIGATKDRGHDERTAFGWINGGWNVVFPESTLRAWFDAVAYPDEQPTLYAILGVKRDATADELKAGWRRMVFQWHPDRCKEPNAQDQFIAIQRAYEVLTTNRDRYDAGLALEASFRNTKPDQGHPLAVDHGYRSPLRCGLIMGEGIETMGVFNVSKIFAWEDVRDSFGRVLVVSWPLGADHFQEVWA